MINKILILILIIVCYSNRAFTQIESSIHFTEDDGLADNTVKSIIKDHQGYLWVGTQNGLSKYDGSRFKNYRKQDGLPGNGVWALASDNMGKIYVGCYLGGLCILQNNKITQVLHLKSKYPDSFRRFYYSKENNVLVAGTDFGIFLLKDSTFIEVPYDKIPNTKNSVLNIIEYKGKIYFTTHSILDSKPKGGIYALRINKQDLQYSTVEKIDKGDVNNFTVAAYNDTIITNSFTDLISIPINNPANQSEYIKLKSKFLPWVSCQINDHELLLGGMAANVDMNSGLEIVDLKTKKKLSLALEFSRVTVNELYHDSINDITWVCTDNGLYSLFKSPFVNYKIVGIDGLKDVNCLGSNLYLLGSKGVYLFADQNFIKICSIKEVEDSIIKFRDNFLRIEKLSSTKFSVDTQPPNVNYLRALNGQLYIVSNNGATLFPSFRTFLPISGKNFVLDEKGGYFYSPDYLPLGYYPSIHKRETNIFLENSGGIKNVLKIIYTKKICFAITWQNGLYAIKDNQLYNLNQSNSQIDNNLTDIEVDPSGEVWCTSIDGHLFHIAFDTQLKVLSKVGQENSSIVGDNFKWLKFNKQNLYIGTNKGLNILDFNKITNHKFDSINFYNRFNGWEPNSAEAPITDDRGNIYLYTAYNLIQIKKEPIKRKISNLTFNSIEINNKVVDEQILSDRILLNSTKSIIIKFLLIKYPSSGNTDYSYRVNNGNKVIGNIINLEPLRPGKYSIKIEAYDKEMGNYYSKIINFQIDFPFWQKWWFIILVSCILVLISYSILKIRIKAVKKQQATKYLLLSQISELQIRSLQVQMNPHFIFNSLNSIQNFVVTQNTRDAITYLGALGSLIRMNLENVSKEAITIEEELEFLQEYIKIEKMRFKQKLKIELKNDIPNRHLFLPPMIVQPIIENAIKHGIRQKESGGLIKVNFKLKGSGILISIEDNGVGREAAQLKLNKNHHSKGLGLIDQRLHLLNMKHNTDLFSLEIIDLEESGHPCGTRVLLNLAIFKD